MCNEYLFYQANVKLPKSNIQTTLRQVLTLISMTKVKIFMTLVRKPTCLDGIFCAHSDYVITLLFLMYF